MKNSTDNNKRISLTRRLTQTILIVILAMSLVWFVFYVNTKSLLNRYVTRNMNQVSMQIIAQLEESFLQMEELSFALASSPEVMEFITSDNTVDFVDRADPVANIIKRYQKSDELMEHVIIYTPKGWFYRFAGNLSNVFVKRLIQVSENTYKNSSIRINLGDTEYIGYISMINDDTKNLGTMVILAEENTLYRVFDRVANNKDMHIALASDDTIIVSKDESLRGMSLKSIIENSNYCSYDRIGFTPFELIITYDNAGREIKNWFIFSMLALAAFLLLILILFILFWRKKFFTPIQQVISDVEQIGDNNTEKISPTGLEHFDGLVYGINDMIDRVEQKEKEIYEANYSLKEAELRKQKALIVSLKKQISAHFTVNVLAVIKALAASGENDKAGSLCDGWSYLLRYANAGDSYIDGMEEFSILQRYVDIMKIRYPDRFNAEIDYDDELVDIKIPRMLLQPIIENSIVHGVVGCEQIGIIHIYSEIEKTQVRFIIEDNGNGISKNDLALLQDKINCAEGEEEIEGLSHVALSNIQRRIVSYYGTGYGINVESEVCKGTKVTVTLPR